MWTSFKIKECGAETKGANRTIDTSEKQNDSCINFFGLSIKIEANGWKNLTVYEVFPFRKVFSKRIVNS